VPRRNGALDIFGGHVRSLGVRDDGAQAWVHVRIAAAGTRRHGQFLDDPGEDTAALRVERALLVLD